MYQLIKRLLDILAALTALTILSPIFVICIIILLLTGEHEVLFFQKRVGFRNQRFYIWKFATMLKNSPNIGTGNITVRDDPRVLPFGKFFRITKLNELPQVFNVLLGDMSIVGPRPLAETGFARYSQEIQNSIYNVKPGITGIGSIVFRDEENLITNKSIEEARQMYTNEIMPYKGSLEMWYQQHASLATDFKLIFLTAWVIVFPTSSLPQKLLKGLPERPEFLK